MSLSHQVEPIFLRVTRPARVSKQKVSFSAVEVDELTLSRLNSKMYYIVEINDNGSQAYISELSLGAVIQLIPDTLLQKSETVNGFQIVKSFVTAHNFNFIRPSGELVIKLLAENSKFKGIGHVKAQKLWNAFGERLYTILDQGLSWELSDLLTEDTAANLIASWKIHVHTDAMLYCCHTLKLITSTAFNVTRFYKEETEKIIQEDPFRLLAFNVSFDQCDVIAKSIHMRLDDERRLSAAVEEALYRVLDEGSSVSSSDEISAHLDTILDKELIPIALMNSHQNSNVMLLDNGYYQSRGAFAMENFIANRIILLQHDSLQSISPKVNLDHSIIKYEQQQGFLLTMKQKQAIHMATQQHFCVINGGAGVGKTTVLDGLYNIFDVLGFVPIQVALAAKAAKRMSEATGRDAYTIARFLRNFEFKHCGPSSKLVLVIDESSMLDLTSMYRLLAFIPDDVRVILVGDAGQLPPIGFGLVLHELLKVHSIPSITLDEVKRQDKDSNIPKVSVQIREGKFPTLDYYDVIHIPAKTKKAVLGAVLKLFLDEGEEVQIICPTRLLTSAINAKCAALNTSKKLLAFNEYYDCYEDSGFKLGDKVVCSRNLYELDVMNGSVGEISNCYKETQIVKIELSDKLTEVSSHGQIIWDDSTTKEITDDILDNLDHAYAMTIHKSQGSQFETVIIPLYKAKNMDRSMLYTAVTRAQKKVIFVGDDSVITNALAQVSAEKRKANLFLKCIKKDGIT